MIEDTKTEQDSKAKLIEHILEKGNFKIPTRFLKQPCIQEMENALSDNPTPLKMGALYMKISNNLDSYFDVNCLNDLINEIISNKDKNPNPKKTVLSEFDYKIIELAVSNPTGKFDFMEMIGPLCFLIESADELESNKGQIPEKIYMLVMLFLFVSIYEYVLYNLDRKLIAYLNTHSGYVGKTQDVKKDFRKFREIKRDKQADHAVAGQIERLFADIIQPTNRDSILSAHSESKLIRDKIAHLNLFYDSDKQRIIVLGGNEYTKEEFSFQYFQLLTFLITWIEKALGKPLDQINFTESLKKEVCDDFALMAKCFYKMNRVPEKRNEFFNIIFEWKKEVNV